MYNKVTVIGHLGRDCELKYLPSGEAVANFSLASTEKRKNEDHTIWFRCALWGDRASKLSQYLTKGKQVYVEGRLRLDQYMDREGQQRTNLEIAVSEIQLLGGGDRQSGSSQEANSSEDEIPF